jgi:replicative DNA helicase Mcm
MEQQTVTVTKAGINATLNARCALLGAANPKYGRFDRYRPIAEQIDLPPTLISRFDLIFVMTDEPNEERDARLTKHILRTHRIGEKLERLKNATTSKYDKKALDDEIKELEPAIGPEILRKYILYAKNKVFPVLTDEANKRLQEFFLSVRRKVNEDSPVPITARQLEALIRLAEASARLRLSDHITAEDADRVISLVRRSLEQIGVDPETGQIDIDYVYSGISRSQRDRIVTVLSIIQEYQNESVWGAPEELILEKAEEQGIDRGRTREILEKLRERGDVYTPKEGYYRSLR